MRIKCRKPDLIPLKTYTDRKCSQTLRLSSNEKQIEKLVNLFIIKTRNFFQ